MRFAEVAEDVHRIGHANVNAYLVGEGGSYTLVDAGLPMVWQPLLQSLDLLGARLSDVSAVVLTHAHFDHVGVAHRVQEQTGAAVHVHADDARLAAHPFRYRSERPPWGYPLRYPRAVPGLLTMVAAGAPWVRGTARTVPMTDGAELDVPGRCRIVHTPGHTDGHCVVSLPDRGVVITGDALVTRDPYTAQHGPRIVSRAATASVGAARASLERIAALDGDVVLPGHGDPWTRGVRRAAEVAHERVVP